MAYGQEKPFLKSTNYKANKYIRQTDFCSVKNSRTKLDP